MGTSGNRASLWGISRRLRVGVGLLALGLGAWVMAAEGPSASSAAAPASAPATAPAEPPQVKILGKIADPAITECSGIVASRKYPGVFWVHCDSGNPAELYAIDRAGKTLATFKINARNIDWEDIAIDDQGRIYLADTGNNSRKRVQVPIIRITEPDPYAQVPADGIRPVIQPEQVFELRYPDKPFDCEALFVLKDKGYLLSKNLDGRQSTMYSFSLEAKPQQVQMLQVVTDLPIRVPVTGADISSDGNELAIQTVTGPHLLTIGGDPSAAGKTPGTTLLYINPNLEAVCFVPEGLLGAAEDRTIILWPRALLVKQPPVGEAPQVELQPAKRSIRLMPMPANMVVDGDLAEWIASPGNEITLQPAIQGDPVNIPQGNAPASGPATDQATAYAQFLDRTQVWCGWQTDGLCIAAQVRTRDVRPLSDAWYTGDCIELFFGFDDPRRDGAYGWGDFRCYAGFQPRMPESKAIIGAAAIRFPFLGDRVPEGAKVQAQLIPGGYAMEIFIPASCLNQALHPTWPAPEDSQIMNPNALRPAGAGFEMVRLPGPRLIWSDHLRMEISILRREPAANWYLCTSNQAGTWMTPLLWSSAVLDVR